MKNCMYCGRNFSDEYQFCPACGNTLRTSNPVIQIEIEAEPKAEFDRMPYRETDDRPAYRETDDRPVYRDAVSAYADQPVYQQAQSQQAAAPVRKKSFGTKRLLIVVAVIAAVAIGMKLLGGGFLPAAKEKTEVPAESQVQFSWRESPAGDHQHSWMPATYSSPETCPSCGETRGHEKGYIGEIDLDVMEMNINGINCDAFKLKTPIIGMRKMTIDFDIEILDDTHCETWNLIIWDGEQWLEWTPVSILGSCTGTSTIEDDGTVDVYGFLYLPTAGGFTWSCTASLHDAQGN